MSLSEEDKRKLEQFKQGIQQMMERQAMERRIKEKMKSIKYKIAIISGKGGVGKSTVTANLAVALALRGNRVAVFDSDFHGPTIPKMLGVENIQLNLTEDKKIVPAKGALGIKVISIYYFLPDPTTAVIWRGPIKRSFLEELLDKTEFGEIDYLLFDLPPGCVTSDSLVYKDSGEEVSISDLRPGDFVYSFYGDIEVDKLMINAELRRSRVLNVIPQGVYPVYRLESETKSIVATYNHPILCVSINDKVRQHSNGYYLEWKALNQIKIGDYIVILNGLGDDEHFGIEKVKNINYIGEKEVYDLEVEDHHNFIANGIVVHNTGDEALNLVQVIPDLTGVIAVTQPTEVSAVAVAKSLDFARKLKIPIIGVVENMSGFICPGEKKLYKIFSGEGGKMVADKFDVPLLGRIPIDPRLSEYGDSGYYLLTKDPECEVSKVFMEIVDNLELSLDNR
jgi:Mrp family chromosome partitioning ATPase